MFEIFSKKFLKFVCLLFFLSLRMAVAKYHLQTYKWLVHLENNSHMKITVL